MVNETTKVEANCEKATQEKVKKLLQDLKLKFIQGTLCAEDFQCDVGLLFTNGLQSINNNNAKDGEKLDGTIHYLDKKDQNNVDDIPVEFELELENGQVKVTSPVRAQSFSYTAQRIEKSKKLTRGISKDEQSMREHMQQLMVTFEKETKNLDRKLEMEKEIMRKKIEAECTLKLEEQQKYIDNVTKEFLEGMEAIKHEKEELILLHQLQKKQNEEFYLKRLQEFQRQMKLDQQRNIIQAHKKWESTKI